LLHSDPSKTPPPLQADNVISNVEKYVQILTRPPVRFCRQTADVVYKLQRRNLLLTITVRCVDKMHEDTKVEQEAGQLLIPLAVFMFVLGESRWQCRGKHGRTQRSCDVTDRMLWIRRLLVTKPGSDCHQLLQSESGLYELVLSVHCRTDGGQQLYQRFSNSSAPLSSFAVSTLSSTPPSTVSSSTASDVSCQSFVNVSTTEMTTELTRRQPADARCHRHLK